jgi:hypothetical protein
MDSSAVKRLNSLKGLSLFPLEGTDGTVEPAYIVGFVLFWIQIVAVVGWVCFAFYQFSKDASEALQNTDNFLLLTTVYPVIIAPASLVPILDQLKESCDKKLCAKVKPQRAWFVLLVLLAVVNAINFGAGLKFYKDRADANVILGYNFVLTFLSAAWAIYVFYKIRRNAITGTQNEIDRN